MIKIARKLIYVRLPMPFGAPIEVVDQNGLTSTFGDSLAYAAFAEGLARFAAEGSDVMLVDSDGEELVGSVDDLSAADRRAIAETLADAATLYDDEEEVQIEVVNAATGPKRRVATK